MATSIATSDVYTQVIEDVINNVRNDFLNNDGPGHALREARMLQAGDGVITHGYDLNVPYEEYQIPTADLLFPPTPMQTPLPVSGETPLPAGTTPFAPSKNLSENGVVSDIKPGRPSQFMEFFTMSSGKRKRDASTSEYINGYIPQQDGSGDAISDDSKFHVTRSDDDEDSDYEPLNENDDDPDDVYQGEDLNTQDLVLTQFDKVDHPQGRWKCTLKNGIIHINKKDILLIK
ncbi:transcription initiation factor IIA large subunit-like [Apium graveolens]|uniref:transcription initiation factor IIA large subunit-like n=1 Tax=Apium graveolens TaxID=4045 RepID=UPI003D790B41